MFRGRSFSFHVGMILLLLCAVWLLLLRKESFSGAAVSNVLQTLAAVYAAVLVLRASSKEEKYWFFYGLGLLVYFVAQLIWTIVTLMRGSEPDYMGIPEMLWRLQFIFYLIALYKQYQQRHSNLAFRFILDILLYGTMASTLYWNFQLKPILSDHYIDGDVVGYNMFNSSFSAVIVFLLLFFSWYGKKTASTRANLFLLSGFVFKLLGNTAFVYLLSYEAAGEYLLWISDLCWFLGLMFIGFAALPDRELQDAYLRPGNESKQTFMRRYALIIFVCAALIAVICRLGEFSIISAGAILAVVLLGIRLSVGIYELESAGAALMQSRVNYDNFAESSLFGVFIEQNGRLVYMNPHGESMFGSQPGLMLGQPLASFLLEEDRDRLKQEFSAICRLNQTSRLAVAARKANQTDLFLEMQAAPAFFKGKPAISGLLLDVTESKLSEQHLIRSEKLSVIGQLAAGVAHEIRNPLTALKGFTQLLHRRTADQNRQYFAMMLTELERINYIVGEFMLLSKPHQWQQMNHCNMASLLDDIVPIMESQAIITNVSISAEKSPDLPIVLCDANQIKQVLVNLMKNAIEAMPGGGELHVHMKKDHKGHIVIDIIDQGIGIPQHVIDRLGEPFYTTKDTGTGLGLTVCFKIIQAHGGSLSISSEPNVGTTATIRLPA
ncbi:ATP-binding protein [Paenibacillus glycanilyticus]|uniref:PAS domain-containing sensor histidine kinase n=1 Tax=Paenibacillus glycanilyticus TaxID=126569 RepID=UPI00203AF4BC|nr:PAS domain-containing sensor histidine kinase [Paenibacillus glycanilyticus]MCM3627850.1 ATP-binding protein [Paenibacillus glycanilyticus]